MVPPFTPFMPPYQIDDSAHISRWEIHSSFDTANECEEARLQANEMHQSDRPDLGPKTRKEMDALRLLYAKCVATDDPRLKGK